MVSAGQMKNPAGRGGGVGLFRFTSDLFDRPGEPGVYFNPSASVGKKLDESGKLPVPERNRATRRDLDDFARDDVSRVIGPDAANLAVF
jgi:hypothetical protein